MSRYEKTDIVKKYYKDEKENKSHLRYTTTIYRKIPLRDDDIYIISHDGDRLDTLAAQFYGDSRIWWYIAQANHINSMNIEVGTSLRIPSRTDFKDSL